MKYESLENQLSSIMRDIRDEALRSVTGGEPASVFLDAEARAAEIFLKAATDVAGWTEAQHKAAADHESRAAAFRASRDQLAALMDQAKALQVSIAEIQYRMSLEKGNWLAGPTWSAMEIPTENKS